MQNRQVDAAFSAAISNESELAAERSRIVQDAINHAHHLVSDANDWLARNTLNALDRYRNGEVCLVIKLNDLSGRSPVECDLVFFTVPSNPVSFREGLWNSATDSSAPPCHELARDADGHEGKVLAGVTKLIQSPEGVISSFVRLERSKERADFRGQILAAAGQIVPPSFFGRTERKLGGLEASIPAGLGGSVTGLVEDRAQVVGGIKEDVGKIGRQPARKLDFVKIVYAIDIFLDSMGPRLRIDKLIDFGVQIVDVMLCAQ